MINQDEIITISRKHTRSKLLLFN